jgi:hypothetical protein
MTYPNGFVHWRLTETGFEIHTLPGGSRRLTRDDPRIPLIEAAIYTDQGGLCEGIVQGTVTTVVTESDRRPTISIEPEVAMACAARDVIGQPATETPAPTERGEAPEAPTKPTPTTETTAAPIPVVDAVTPVVDAVAPAPVVEASPQEIPKVPAPLAEPPEESSAKSLWKHLDRVSNTDLGSLDLSSLRKYARHCLGIVGASKIRGGKRVLISRIVQARAVQ